MPNLSTKHKPAPVATGFSLPEVGDMPLSREEMARLVQQSVEEMAAELHCTRLVALAYLPALQQLHGVTTAGIGEEGIRAWNVPLAAFPLAAQALRARALLVTDNALEIPFPLSTWFCCQTVLIPLVFGDRVLALLVGQTEEDVDPDAPGWREQARQVAARAGVLVELLRVRSEYEEELRRRHYTRELAAAILEGRPLRDVAELITELIAERLRVERVALYLLDGANTIYPIVLRNISAEYGNTITRFMSPAAAVARATATGLPHYVHDVQNDPNSSAEKRALHRSEGIHSVLRAMLQHGDRVLGALVIYPQVERVLNAIELSLFQSFADMATLAIAMSQQMEQQRTLAMVEERNRLAREMHDTVAQSLAALLLQIETTQNYLIRDDGASARDMLDLARAQAKKALEDTRRAIQGLSPTPLDRLSLTEAIEAEAHELQYQADIATQFILSGEEQALNPDQRATLLRIAQEALTNARKHAQAKRVRVGLQYGAEEVALLVEDDGVGFDVTARSLPDVEGGYGLFGMSERVRLVGGDLVIDSTPGWGTRIRASVPYRPASLVEAGRQARYVEAAATPETPSNSHPGADTPTRSAADSAIPAPPSPAAIVPPAPASPSLSDTPLRVLVVDDHALARQGVRSVLEASGDVMVVGEAANGLQGAERARELRPDVVLMDWQMPDSSGLEGLQRIHADQPTLPVVILTTFQTDQVVSEALAAGARGFLLKDTDPMDLLSAIRAAHRGETLLAASVTDRLAALASGQSARASNDAGLNEREREVLQLLAQGARNKEIAARLFIAPKTVEYHLSNLFSKLDVSNRTEAARVALERGLIVPGERAGK